jgi:hypothetical protein
LQQCGKLFNHPDLWRGHVGQHHVRVTLHNHSESNLNFVFVCLD